MRLAGVLPCSFVNGTGARYVIFVQGCAHGCPGCQNPETHDFGGGYEVPVEELAAVIRDAMSRHPLDGITLSGGDPYYQPGECCKLLDLLPGVPAWIYTGFEWADIKHDNLTSKAEAVVVGPYIEALRCEGKMYGSSNQRVIYPAAELSGGADSHGGAGCLQSKS